MQKACTTGLAGTLSEQEEMYLFCQKYGSLIPDSLTTVSYISRAHKPARKSKANNRLMSISFCLESQVLRAGVGAHHELPITLSKNGADATSSWVCALKVQEGSDQRGKILYFQGSQIQSPRGEEGLMQASIHGTVAKSGQLLNCMFSNVHPSLHRC